MSCNASGQPLLDLISMRDMILSSQVFGAAHLVCATRTRMRSPATDSTLTTCRGTGTRRSTLTLTCPLWQRRRLSTKCRPFSMPSYADTDTTLRGQEPTAEHLMQHSVGLVRVWLQWFPLADASTTGDNHWRRRGSMTPGSTGSPTKLPATPPSSTQGSSSGTRRARRPAAASRASGAAATTRSASSSAAPSAASSTSTRTRTRASGCACARAAATSTSTAIRTNCAPARAPASSRGSSSSTARPGTRSSSSSARPAAACRCSASASSRASPTSRAPTACAPSATGTTTKTRRRAPPPSTSSSPCRTASCGGRTAPTPRPSRAWPCSRR
jgi:hypothetical protein